MRVLKIGTRKSPLAVWQAEQVKQALEKGGYRAELVFIDSLGDKDQKKAIPALGSQGVFTAELEAALRAGDIHLAAHSAKDLPATTPEDLPIIAFGKREETHDVLVSKHKVEPGKKLKIGTASTRRVALMKRYFPQWEAVSIRGNLQTRLRKMEEGHCEALWLAAAGVLRSEMKDRIAWHFDLHPITPMAGQGSVALQGTEALDEADRQSLCQLFNDEQAEQELLTERAFLRTLQGGCSIPSFALARVVEDKIVFEAGLVSLDGKEEIRIKSEGSNTSAEALGVSVAENLLEKGGLALLEKIRKTLDQL